MGQSPKIVRWHLHSEQKPFMHVVTIIFIRNVLNICKAQPAEAEKLAEADLHNQESTWATFQASPHWQATWLQTCSQMVSIAATARAG